MEYTDEQIKEIRKVVTARINGILATYKVLSEEDFVKNAEFQVSQLFNNIYSPFYKKK